MARRLIVSSVILGLIAAQLCAAQPLQVSNACPMKTRCCRMLPTQPTDAVKPQAPQIALVEARVPVVTEMPALPAERSVPAAPVREVPTRTIQLRI